MPEEIREGETPAEAMAGESPTPAQPEKTPGRADLEGQRVFSVEYVRELREEAARNRIAARQLEEQIKQLQQEREREREQFQQTISDARRELSELRIKSAFESACARLDIRDRAAAYALVDRSRVEFDEAGNPTNIEQLLEEVVQERPWIRGAVTVVAANPPRDGGGERSERRISLGSAIASYYQRLKEQI